MAEKIFAKQPDHGIVFLWLDSKVTPEVRIPVRNSVVPVEVRKPVVRSVVPIAAETDAPDGRRIHEVRLHLQSPYKFKMP